MSSSSRSKTIPFVQKIIAFGLVAVLPACSNGGSLSGGRDAAHSNKKKAEQNVAVEADPGTDLNESPKADPLPPQGPETNPTPDPGVFVGCPPTGIVGALIVKREGKRFQSDFASCYNGKMVMYGICHSPRWITAFAKMTEKCVPLYTNNDVKCQLDGLHGNNFGVRGTPACQGARLRWTDAELNCYLKFFGNSDIGHCEVVSPDYRPGIDFSTSTGRAPR